MELIKTATYGSLSVAVTIENPIPKDEGGCQSPFFIQHFQTNCTTSDDACCGPQTP